MIFWLATVTVFVLALWNAARERRLLPRPQWLALASLRLAGLALLALALWELDPWGALPSRRRPMVLAVVDGSRSMQRRDGLAQTRYQRALSDAKALADGRRDLDVRIAAGREDALAAPGREATGGFTDIGRWIYEALGRHPDGLTLFSDGNHNAGGDPLAASAGAGRPVFTLGYGPPEAAQTPAILDAWAPERVGLGRAAVIRASVKAGGRPLVLTAEVNGRAAGSRRVAAGAERTELFERLPDGPGMHRVRLTLADGNDTLDRRTVAFLAEKDRLQAVCLCGSPDWNLRFLKQAVAADPGIGMSTFVRRQGRWEGADWDDEAPVLKVSDIERADLLLLLNLRPGDLGPDIERTIVEAARRKGTPLLFMGAGWDETFRSSEIHHLLPLHVRRQGGRVQGRLEMEAGHLAMLVSGLGDPGNLSARMRRMPPVWSPREIAPASKAVSVAATNSADGKQIPVWAWWYQGRAKAAQLAVEDPWSWGLGEAGKDAPGGDTTFYGRFVRGTLRWLAGMPGHAVEVGPERGFYHAGEEVRIRGRHQPAAGRDEDGTAWRMSLSGDSGQSRRRGMARWGGGEYQASFAGLPQGSYQWQSELSVGGRVIDRSQGRFWVEPNAGEQGGLVQQAGLLRSLAEVSGGRYWDRQPAGEGQGWLEGIRVVPGKTSGQTGPLALALAGLALIMAEWYWRRRWGLK